MTRTRNDLRSLRSMIAQAHDILRTTLLPEARSQRAYELLTAALHLTDNLIAVPPAAQLGKLGGKQTAKRGPDYFRKIAGMRKKHGGGRPQKSSKPN